MDIYEAIPKALESLAVKKPLIHHITNFVVMNETANATLAMNASPVMAHAAEEVEEMASMASALLLNIGTLTPELIESMLKAGKAAMNNNVPIILDPVGAGATRLRTESCRRLLSELDINIIRANAAEASVLADMAARIKGVDSAGTSESAEDIAGALAARYKCVAAVTGPVDIVCDGSALAKIDHGHPMMATVTGTGCIATTAVAVFASVTEDPFMAASCALTFYGIAGEMAALETEGRPGSFHVALYDKLAQLTKTGVEGVRVEIIEPGV